MKRIKWLCVIVCALLTLCSGLSPVSCGEDEGYARNPKKDIPFLCDIINEGDPAERPDRFFEDAELSSLEEITDLSFEGEYCGEQVCASSGDGFISCAFQDNNQLFTVRDGYFSTVEDGVYWIPLR